MKIAIAYILRYSSKMASRYCLPKVIAHLIAEYSATWEIAPWVRECRCFDEIEKNDSIESYGSHLSANPMAGDLYHTVKFPISWYALSRNSADWALDILEKHQNSINWNEFSENRNPRAIALLEKNLGCADVEMLSTNPAAFDMMIKNHVQINTAYLMWNPAAEGYIKANNIPINLCAIVCNSAPWAVEIFKDRLNELGHTYGLSRNTNPWVINWFEDHFDKIQWEEFSRNPAAIDILRANPNYVSFYILENPEIFEPKIPCGFEDELLAI